MTYLSTPIESPLYQAERAALGYVPNYLRVLALGPEVYDAWRQLGEAVKAGMDPRRYELVTLTAARRLGSAYCGLAHAAVLRERFYDDAALLAILADRHDAGLAPVDVAVMDFAEHVAADPVTVAEADIETLRGHGLVDGDIFQIVLAVCLRRFFSGILSAVGAVPDPVFDELHPGIRAALGTTGVEAVQELFTTDKEKSMVGKAVVSLTTGLEDPERVTVAFLVAVGAAEQGRPTLMFLTKEAARLALDGVATAIACDGCPQLADLVARYAKAGGRYLVCPICFHARVLDRERLIEGAELGGTVPMWQWIGDEGATTFSY